MKTKTQKIIPLRFMGYTALVKTPTGEMSVFYGPTEPVIGSECPGAQKPNKVISFKFE